MAKFSLKKEEEKVRFILEKKGVIGIVAAVCLNIDVSGSMEKAFQRGLVQQALQRVLPVGLNFDDNRNLDVNLFSGGTVEVESVTENNFETYVQEEILRKRHSEFQMWGGTLYSPVLLANLKKYGLIGKPAPAPKIPKEKGGGFFSSLASLVGLGDGDDDQDEENEEGDINPLSHLRSETETGYPAVVYMATDGDNETNDEEFTEEILAAAERAKCNIYFHFIGIGTESKFLFLKKMAERFGNVGFVQATDLATAVDDDSMYELLLPRELTEWLRLKKN